MTLETPQANAPIGVFDSGVGGFSVLQHVREILPNEALCYFADSGFAPYGDKTEAEIVERTSVAAEHLLANGAKALVVACNTATAAAIAAIRAHYPSLIVVGVEPGLKPAAQLTKSGIAGVIATTATIASQKYQTLAQQIEQSSGKHFIHQACPGLADQIDKGELDTDQTRQLLQRYLAPILNSDADVLALGCTHYTFVEPGIRAIFNEHGKSDITIIDTGIAIARQLQRQLAQAGLLNTENQTSNIIRCMTSGRAKQVELAFTQLLKLDAQHFTTQEINCALPLNAIEYQIPQTT